MTWDWGFAVELFGLGMMMAVIVVGGTIGLLLITLEVVDGIESIINRMRAHLKG